MLEVAGDVYCGTGTDVNWIVIREGSDLTLVDSGWSGDFGRLEASVGEIEGRLEDIRAVLLTHAHADHVGGLNRLWDQYQIPVFMHALELSNACGAVRETAGPIDVLRRAWRPRVSAWGLRMIRAGGLHHEIVLHGQAYEDRVSLDLPGRPVPIPCPGHTSGHSAYLFPRHGIIATGDALVTGHPLFGSSGPQLLPAPFSLTNQGALAGLDALVGIDAEIVLPGHGLPFHGGLAAAVERAREKASAGRLRASVED